MITGYPPTLSEPDPDPSTAIDAATFRIEGEREGVCPTCVGNGYVQMGGNDWRKSCPTCHGTGRA